MLDDIVQREQRLIAELEEERVRAERFAEKLRKLGVDPDAD